MLQHIMVQLLLIITTFTTFWELILAFLLHDFDYLISKGEVQKGISSSCMPGWKMGLSPIMSKVSTCLFMNVPD